MIASNVAALERATTGSSPRRVCSDDLAATFASRAHQTSGLAHRDDRAASRRLARRQKVLVEVHEDHDAAAAHPLPDRLGAHDDSRQRRVGSLAAVTSLTGWDSCAATSRASVVTPTRTRFRFVAPQTRQNWRAARVDRGTPSCPSTSSSAWAHIGAPRESPHLRHAKQSARAQPLEHHRRPRRARHPSSARCAASSASRDRAPSCGSLVAPVDDLDAWPAAPSTSPHVRQRAVVEQRRRRESSRCTTAARRHVGSARAPSSTASHVGRRLER